MAIVAIIMSSLALLAAIVNITLTIRERKLSQERNVAQMQYADSVGRETETKAAQAAQAQLRTFSESMETRIVALENGVIPDFEKAKAAADAVNDFNTGITGILNYDPFEALKTARAKESGGGIE